MKAVITLKGSKKAVEKAIAETVSNLQYENVPVSIKVTLKEGGK